jgi:hypothetical protein
MSTFDVAASLLAVAHTPTVRRAMTATSNHRLVSGIGWICGVIGLGRSFQGGMSSGWNL